MLLALLDSAWHDTAPVGLHVHSAAVLTNSMLPQCSAKRLFFPSQTSPSDKGQNKISEKHPAVTAVPSLPNFMVPPLPKPFLFQIWQLSFCGQQTSKYSNCHAAVQSQWSLISYIQAKVIWQQEKNASLVGWRYAVPNIAKASHHFLHS